MMAFLGAGFGGAEPTAEPLNQHVKKGGKKRMGGSGITLFLTQLVHLELLERELRQCANELQAD